MVRDKIAEIAAQISGFDAQELIKSEDFIEEFFINSLKEMMIFERVENEFDVSIDIDKYYKDVRNINKLAALVEKLIK